MFYQEHKWKIVIALLVITIITNVYFITQLTRNKSYKNLLISGLVKVDYGLDDISTSYVPEREYFETFSTTIIPDNYNSFTSIDSTVKFKDESASFSEYWEITEPNKALYDLADRYYQVYYGRDRVSPLYPLAIANVETGSRADRNITWSALFPSKILPVDLLTTADVTTVISSPEVFKALSTEWSTRDRGAMQMSPTYGTSKEYFNKQMSGTEVEKLKNVDTSKYSQWASGASTKYGDRFYVPDVCLRLASANTDAIERMLDNGYIPETNMQLIAMLAMYHHRSGVWSNKNHDSKCGEWKSSGLAYEFSSIITSKGFIEKLKSYAMSNPTAFTIDRKTATTLYKEYFTDTYTKYTESELVGTYPILVVYSYIKMNIMYSSN